MRTGERHNGVEPTEMMGTYWIITARGLNFDTDTYAHIFSFTQNIL